MMVPRAKVDQGLSPRVRGNLGTAQLVWLSPGSIPAGAGEPWLCQTWRTWTRVYPRGCGGTPDGAVPVAVCQGLSPRVRGNPVHVYLLSPRSGSIPAGAGEPPDGAGAGCSRGVYPRGCGGTVISPADPLKEMGLSPRVRGNRDGGGDQKRRDGSIPAGAGEPSLPAALLGRRRVYPRGCGGTGMLPENDPLFGGLSPRVRGNPLRPARRTGPPGSIPAGAGEPLASNRLILFNCQRAGGRVVIVVTFVLRVKCHLHRQCLWEVRPMYRFSGDRSRWCPARQG